MKVFELKEKVISGLISHEDKESLGLSFRLFVDKFLVVEGENENSWTPSISCDEVSKEYAQSELDKNTYTDPETGEVVN